MKKILAILVSIIIMQPLFAQMKEKPTATNVDTLDSVTVKAFAWQANSRNVPAAIAVITQSDLHKFNNSSLVPVFNTIPGVRMEERSPGSYRLSLRGSLLRSPFGVRDVKIYWNDIMLTDAGGNTYLQLVDVNHLENIELIKGPASSLYGANTGGAVILHSGNNIYNLPHHSLSALIGGGSFGMFNEQLGWKYSGKSFTSTIQQSHQQADGYRQQSAMRRDVVKWDGNWQISSKEELSFLAFYTDLYYQTPGGITLQQMQQDPTLSRQPTSTLPGAVQQKTAIYNRTAFGGVSLHSIFSAAWDNTTTITLNHTHFDNPFITDYEKRNEWNYGARTTFQYHVTTSDIKLNVLAGAEWQQNKSHINDYGNRNGEPDTVQFKDKAGVTQYFLFAQLNAEIGSRWIAQAGVSNNWQQYMYRRLTDPTMTIDQKKDDGSLLAPRFSLLYKINNNIAAYGVVAEGFSPPALAEMIPQDKTYHGDLKPEHGWNYEIGIKGADKTKRVLFDASIYWFGLNDAIVSRTNTLGAQYFINAGNTMQNGAELWVKYFIIRNTACFITSLSVAESFSYQPYKFGTYIYGNANNSGNKLTGVPKTISVSTIELNTKPGYFCYVSVNNTSSIPLTDANDVFAEPYHLLQAKLGYRHSGEKIKYQLYMGGDNLLNELYSLGNDINAAGKRYYNPAATRNFFAGISVNIN
jgi:iron complex outermembrane receptor protein